jgi:hypothetical protein
MKGLHQICLVLLFVCRPVFAQITKADYYNKIDNTMFLLSKNKELRFDSIVSNVLRLYPKNEDKVRAYYTWVALNIAYDTERLKALKENKGFMRKDSSQEADLVFTRKKAVCEGFSKLMVKFCEASNIPCKMVVGYTKMPEGEVIKDILHAWNAVKIDSAWKLLDVTWSNGYVGFQGLYYKHFSDKYFIEGTSGFYKDHLPLDPQWQLSKAPISKNYFLKTDTLNKHFVNHIFNFNDSISYYMKQNKDNQAWLDYVHYYRYDNEEKRYLDYADYMIYDNANYILNNGALDFEEYQIFYSKTLSKEKTKVNCKKAKMMLEASKSKHIEALNYLTNKKAFSKEFSEQLEVLRKNVNGNLLTINQHLIFIEKLQKSSSVNKK